MIGCGLWYGRSIRSMATIIAPSDGLSGLRSSFDDEGFSSLIRFSSLPSMRLMAARIQGDYPMVDIKPDGDLNIQ